MNDHPDLEALSAELDGEDEPGAVASHLQACRHCRALADGLQRARRAVGAPVAPPPRAVRERMLAAALAEAGSEEAGAGEGTAPVVALPERDRRRWWAVGGGAAAAVVALVVGAAGFLGRGPDPGDETALSQGPPPAAESLAGSASGGGQARAAGPAVVDLGDVADVAALRGLVAATVGAAQARSGDEAARAAGPSTALSPPAQDTATVPCHQQARSARPGAGTVVYVATARFAGTPAVVLGFGATPGSPPTTALVLAEPGCRLLAETPVP